MQVIVLLGIVAAWSMSDSEVAGHLARAGWWTPLALAAYLAAVAAVGRLHVAAAGRAFGAAAPALARRRAALAASAEKLCLLGGFAGLLSAGGLQWMMTPLAGWPLVGKLALLAPFVAGLVVMWLNHYSLHRRMKLRAAAAAPDQPPSATWTRGQFLAFNLRTHLLMILVPVSLIMLANDLLLMARPRLPESADDELIAAGVVVSAALVFLLAPMMIVHIWRTAPMENCPLLSKLKATCRRLGLRYRRILIWRSGGVLVNAGVMGLIPQVRYILLSDGLVEQMPFEQVEAVFAHEAAHVTNHHIFYSGVFMAATGLWIFLLEEWAIALLGWSWWIDAAAMAVLVAAWALGFGWLSRRFERQCDVAAAWQMGRPADADADDDGTITTLGAEIFARSLESVARLNGIPARRFNWRHGSIAGRVSHVLWLGAAGRSRSEIDHLVARVKVGLWMALAAVVVTAVVLFSLVENNP